MRKSKENFLFQKITDNAFDLEELYYNGTTSAQKLPEVILDVIDIDENVGINENTPIRLFPASKLSIHNGGVNEAYKVLFENNILDDIITYGLNAYNMEPKKYEGIQIDEQTHVYEGQINNERGRGSEIIDIGAKHTEQEAKYTDEVEEIFHDAKIDENEQDIDQEINNNENQIAHKKKLSRKQSSR
ncbi:hypothetical protein HHI36_015085 [Cryptolaemus montrouzieri]|uniref:Uncharacterized protein n=1 Tax=Cryptolaemus montrouzieri TaxID=559131 RepID=A0ABD2N4N4_9CUCU